MQDTPKISVIVPIYNSETFLRECIESILSQSFRDFELILVNDGSTDDSSEICHSFQSQDNRIKLINKVNEGVSVARNVGIYESKGNWITFIDSDDWIDHEYLRLLYSAVEDNVDLIQSGLIFFNTETEEELGRESLADSYHTMPENRFEIVTQRLITSPVSKLYRREIIIKNNIFFDKGKSYGEDRDFNLRYLRYVSSVKAINYMGYYYRKGLDDNLSNCKDYLSLLHVDLQYWGNLYNFLTDKSTNRTSDFIEKYLANRLFNFYNDRFCQFSSSQQPTFSELVRIIKEEMSVNPFDWLIRHVNLIDSSIQLKAAYHSPYLLAFYLKMISKHG